MKASEIVANALDEASSSEENRLEEMEVELDKQNFEKFRREHPNLTEEECERYLGDPELQWNPDGLKEDDQSTWQPILKKNGEITRIPPVFSSPFLITDENEFNREMEDAGDDEKKKDSITNRWYTAIKRESYAETDGWASPFPKLKFAKK